MIISLLHSVKKNGKVELKITCTAHLKEPLIKNKIKSKEYFIQNANRIESELAHHIDNMSQFE